MNNNDKQINIIGSQSSFIWKFNRWWNSWIYFPARNFKPSARVQLLTDNLTHVPPDKYSTWMSALWRHWFSTHTTYQSKQLVFQTKLCYCTWFGSCQRHILPLWTCFQHTWHWVVYGSAHFLSDATPCSTGPASDSSHWGSAAGWVYKDGSWNQTAAVSSADIRHVWQGNSGATRKQTRKRTDSSEQVPSADRHSLVRNKIFQTAHTPLVSESEKIVIFLSC